MADPAEIARRLSPAQKRALLWLPEDGGARQLNNDAPREVSFFVLRQLIIGNPQREVALMAELCRDAPPRFDDGRWQRGTWSLTHLGTQVRAVVEQGGDA
jgi:hypothetical protein